MKHRIICKGLAVALILLFVGVGFQPALALTVERGNNPPDKPEIYGPVRWPVNVEIEFAFSSTDPDGDDVKYYIDWGDDTEDETGYYQSGEIVTISHIYREINTYLLRAKAIDVYGYESEWSYNEIPINEDDCKICQSVSKKHLVKINSLIYKIDKNRNKLSLLSKYNPETEEKFKKISNRFSFLEQFSENYIFYWEFPVICSSFFIILLSIILFQFLFFFNIEFPALDFMIGIIDSIGFKLNCPWYIHPPLSF
jgi:hypothetical protein